MAKNQGFLKRLGYALTGIAGAYKKEQSFRSQVWMALLAIIALAILKVEPIWWAVVLVLIGSILALEMLNTSLENFIDRVHKEHHEQIGFAKDCAAGAVLILSFISLVVFALLIFDKVKGLQ